MNECSDIHVPQRMHTDFGDPLFLYSATMRFCVIALKFAAHIHVPLRMNCKDLDPFRFLLAPSAGVKRKTVYFVHHFPMSNVRYKNEKKSCQ